MPKFEEDTEKRLSALEEEIILLKQELVELKLSFKQYRENSQAALSAASRHIIIGGR